MISVHFSSLPSDEQVVNPTSPDISTFLSTAQKSYVCFPISLELSSSGFYPTSTSWDPRLPPSLCSRRAVGRGWTAFGSADTFGMAKNEHMCSDMPWIFAPESWFDFLFLLHPRNQLSSYSDLQYCCQSGHVYLSSLQFFWFIYKVAFCILASPNSLFPWGQRETRLPHIYCSSVFSEMQLKC